MTDPIRARKADRWDALVAGGASPDSATAQVEREFRTATDSVALTGPISGPSRPTRAAANPATNHTKGLLRAAGGGLLMGFEDEAEAAVRSLRDPRGYRAIRDEIRGEQDAYELENPKKAFAASLAPGLLGGVALARAGFMNAAPAGAKMATGLLGRLGKGAAIGAATGAVSGVGTAREMSDAPTAAGKGALIGGVLGGGAAGAGELAKGARNLIGGWIKGDRTEGARVIASKFAVPEDPELIGARRVLRRVNRGGATLADVRRVHESSPASLSLAEVVDDARGASGVRGQGTEGLRIARNAGRERDAIDASLQERAADTPERFRSVVSRETGVREPIAADVYKQKALKSVEGIVARYTKLARKQPDVHAPEVARVVADLVEMGEQGVLQRARKIAAGRNALRIDQAPTETISVRNLQHLRRAMDRRIEELKALAPADNEMVDILGKKRAVVDRALKGAGGRAQKKADALWEAANRRAEAYNTGTMVERRTDAAQVTEKRIDALRPTAATRIARREAERARLPQMESESRALVPRSAAPDVEQELEEAYRGGAASQLLSRLSEVADGEVGNVRNPTVGALAGPLRRARTREALFDDDSFARLRAEGKQINRELSTRQRVSGNSTTMANTAEAAAEFEDPIAIAHVALNPSKAGERLLADRLRSISAGMSADQATAMGRLFSAGLPEQMSRDEAVALLERALPGIFRQQRAANFTRGLTAGAGTQGLLKSIQP